MSIHEIFEKLDQKKLATLDRHATIKVNRTLIDEEKLKNECESRGYQYRYESGMFLIW